MQGKEMEEIEVERGQKVETFTSFVKELGLY